MSTNEEFEYKNHMYKTDFVFEKDDAVWCIGDVHGCADEYEQLLEEIDAIDPEATVFQLGDLIDRGPHFYKVFELSHVWKVICIVGNHEINFMQEQAGKPCRSRARQVSHEKYNAMFDFQKRQVDRLLDKLIPYAHVQIGDRKFFLSHSIPKNVENECPNDMDGRGWAKYCYRSDPAEAQPKFGGVIVHGHQQWIYEDIQVQIDSSHRILNIDSGCVYGKELIALRLNDMKVIRVKAKKDYAESGI